jgi:tetratricopeptide (TPR) repeat protein
LSASFALSQTGGQTGGTGGTTGGSTTTVKPAPSVVPRPTIPPPTEERRPVFLSGRVMLDDGTPPTERVAIERVCNGHARRETYTDSHGQFSFQMGAEAPLFQDASVGGGFGASQGALGMPNSGNPSSPNMSSLSGYTSRELMGCEIRASLAGFRSDSIPLAGRQLFDNPEIGTIFLHRLGKVEGSRISLTTLKAPKAAKKAFERGMNLLKKHKEAEARDDFAKAVAEYPQYAEALVKLGELDMELGHVEEAEKLFQRAIAADRQFLPPYFDLVIIAGGKQDWKQMAEMSDRALALNAYEYPAAYYFNAVANYNLHNLAIAEKNARAARRLDSQYRIPRIDFLLANILLQRDDFAGAAQELRTYLKYVPAGPDANLARELLGKAESKVASAANK